MKRRKTSKVGLITKMPREKFYISFGWNKKEAKKAARGYRGGGFARVLTKNQYIKILNSRGRLTPNRVRKLIKK